MKKVHSFLNYFMGAIMIVAIYQALLKYPEYGTKLLSIKQDPTAYSPTLILSTLTAIAKGATYFLHKTSSMLKRKKTAQTIDHGSYRDGHHLFFTCSNTTISSIYLSIDQF